MDNKTAAVNLMNLTANLGVNSIPNFGKGGQSAEISFSDTFVKSSEVKPAVDMSDKVSAKKTVVESGSVNNSNIKSAEDVNKRDINSLDKEETKDISEAVSKAVDEIKDEIKSKFSVSDEDIEKAMEVLGLSMQDLFNGADLRSLVMELTGTSDSIELITNVELYDGLKEITAFAENLLTETAEEFGLSNEQLTELMESEGFKAVLDEAGTEATDGVDATESVNTEASVKMETVIEITGESKTLEVNAEDEDALKTVTEANDKPVLEKVADDEKRPEAKVEIERSNEARTADPVEVKVETKNSDSMNQQSDSKKNNLFDNSKGSEISTVQTQTTQTVNTVGDIVETVTSYTTGANTENIMRQVTEYVKVNITEDVTKMEMQLHPASLGTVNMQLNSQNGQITAHLTVQNELVKSVLESQMIRLQETFNEQGTKVTSIEVSVATSDLNSNSDNSYSQERENRGGQSKSRRGINLSELGSFDELTTEEQLEAKVMEMNGSSVNYRA